MQVVEHRNQAEEQHMQVELHHMVVEALPEEAFIGAMEDNLPEC